MSSLNELGNTPVSTALASNGPPIPGLLSNVATLKRESVPTNLNQTNIQPVYDDLCQRARPRSRQHFE